MISEDIEAALTDCQGRSASRAEKGEINGDSISLRSRFWVNKKWWTVLKIDAFICQRRSVSMLNICEGILEGKYRGSFDTTSGDKEHGSM